MNICGCLVHIDPSTTGDVRSKLEAFKGVEVHAVSKDGRFVVVVEDTDQRRASETIMELHQVPGVLSLTLTYHHFEENPEIIPQPAGGLAYDHL